MLYFKNDEIIKLSLFTTLVDLLCTSFKDSDREQTAQTALANLKQKNSDFVFFIATFQQYTSHINYNNKSLKSMLCNVILQELKQVTVMYDIFKDINEYICVSQCIL